MTGSISRKLFQQFLLLYPEPFRHEFGDEMLSMFEECRAAQCPSRLLADVLLSAARQQIRYVSTPAPKSAPLYSEIASSPNLARILAIAVFVAALIPGVLVGGKPKAPESWAVEVRFWFPTGIVVVERKPNTRDYWRVLRQESRISFPKCSVGPERTSQPASNLSSYAGREHWSGLNDLGNTPR